MRDAARFFKVLADEARLKMLWLLFNHNELCVCDVMAALQITQSKASRHLTTLRHANLVTDRKAGLWSYYALCAADDEFTRQHLALLRATLAARADAEVLLDGLHDWLRAKNRDATCAKGSVCAATKKRRPARRPPRLSVAGGPR
jgi:ArsR family transcriptional regulator, arsenate/arsenite/antimonite-responsive transcriptional repressor